MKYFANTLIVVGVSLFAFLAYKKLIKSKQLAPMIKKVEQPDAERQLAARSTLGSTDNWITEETADSTSVPTDAKWVLLTADTILVQKRRHESLHAFRVEYVTSCDSVKNCYEKLVSQIPAPRSWASGAWMIFGDHAILEESRNSLKVSVRLHQEKIDKVKVVADIFY